MPSLLPPSPLCTDLLCLTVTFLILSLICSHNWYNYKYLRKLSYSFASHVFFFILTLIFLRHNVSQPNPDLCVILKTDFAAFLCSFLIFPCMVKVKNETYHKSIIGLAHFSWYSRKTQLRVDNNDGICTYYFLVSTRKVHRVPEFLSLLLNWVPHPLPYKRVCLSPLGPGGSHTRWRGGGVGVEGPQIRRRGSYSGTLCVLKSLYASSPLPFSTQLPLSEFLSLLILAKENASGSREKCESPLSGSACISADGSWKWGGLLWWRVPVSSVLLMSESWGTVYTWFTLYRL